LDVIKMVIIIQSCNFVAEVCLHFLQVDEIQRI
jgi:hypothetical protein